ncbi:hypothetical protein TNCV_4514451 [Trichonephila clavipes]|nr:hypothetical protein TNCV_4514451 [Trichonephila clavipes]
MLVKYVEVQTSSLWFGGEFRGRVPAQVSSSSLEQGSKLRGSSPIALSLQLYKKGEKVKTKVYLDTVWMIVKPVHWKRWDFSIGLCFCSCGVDDLKNEPDSIEYEDRLSSGPDLNQLSDVLWSV